MPVPQGFVKAALEIDTLGEIQCYFNPSEYSISKSNEWSYDKVTGTSFPPAKFGGGAPRELSLSLLLDVSLLKDGDTLPSIAYEQYGDPTVWRAIADANGIENPLKLRRGHALSLPKLDG